MKPFKRVPEGDPRHKDANYYVQFQVAGKAYLFCTKISDNAVVAVKRGKAYRDAIVAKAYGLADGMKQGGGAPLIEDLIAAYLALPAPPEPTRKANANALLAVLKVSGLNGKDRVARIDRSVIANYQTHCMKQRPGDMSAVTTANSITRKARSVFSKRALNYYYGTPNQVPDDVSRAIFSVPMLREVDRRPEIPDDAAVAKAHKDLPANPMAYRVFLLGAYGGLRAGEMVAARRDWLEGCKLYVGGREFHAKSRRWRCVELPQQVVDALLMSDDPVFLVGNNRRQFIRREMAGILRGVGFESDKPLHSLRRLAGSLVYNQQGPRQARDFLGHAAQFTTDRFYARSKNAPAAIPFAG
jgi:integrase